MKTLTVKSINDVIAFLNHYIVECDIKDNCGRCDDVRECVRFLHQFSRPALSKERIIDVLKNRYITAHCNPDFKGDKMSFIFDASELQPEVENSAPLPEEILAKVCGYNVIDKDSLSDDITVSEALEAVRVALQSPPQSISLPEDKEIEKAFPTDLKTLCEDNDIPIRFDADQGRYLDILRTGNVDRQRGAKWMRSQVKTVDIKEELRKVLIFAYTKFKPSQLIADYDTILHEYLSQRKEQQSKIK